MSKAKSSSSKTLTYLGLLGGAAILAGAGGANIARAAKLPYSNSGGYSGGSSGCPYPPQEPPPLKKSWLDLADRIYQRIIEDNPALGREHCDECGGRSVAHVVAGALSQAWGLGVPPDLVTAVARRESNFNPYVDRVAYSLEISHNGEECIPGSEIGPMQVMPCAFRQVGMDPTRLLHVNFFERVYLATAAGIRYLAWLKSQFPTWCDVLNAYNVGPGAFREGERSPEYVSTIIRWAIEYSELRVG